MTTGPGLDRTGVMTPEQTHGLVNPASAMKGLLGGLQATRVANAITDEKVYRSSFIPADKLGVGFNFKLDLAGQITVGGADDVTLDFDFVEPDGTRVTLLTITTASLAAEADKGFALTVQGRVALEQDGVTSGKFATVGWLEVFQGTPLRFQAVSAIAGVSADFRNGGHFEITGNWDQVTGATGISLISALLAVCNLPGSAGE